MELRKGDLQPGQRVSADHYQSAVPGRLYSSRGGASRADMFTGGCIFVDHASGLVQVLHQVSLSAIDTVKSKLKFERMAAELGVKIQSYHTDNGVFTSTAFMENVMEHKQNIRFSGVGAAHQNGLAERHIRTVVEIARTLLIHATRQASVSICRSLLKRGIDINATTVCLLTAKQSKVEVRVGKRILCIGICSPERIF